MNDEIRRPGWGHPIMLLAIAWIAVAVGLVWLAISRAAP